MPRKTTPMRPEIPAMPEAKLHKLCIKIFYAQHGRDENFFIFHPANENPKGTDTIRAIIYNKQQKALRRVTGVPDLCIQYRGKVFYIEFKKIGGYLSPAQKETKSKIEIAGSKVFVVKTTEEFEKAINDIKEAVDGVASGNTHTIYVGVDNNNEVYTQSLQWVKNKYKLTNL